MPCVREFILKGNQTWFAWVSRREEALPETWFENKVNSGNIYANKRCKRGKLGICGLRGGLVNYKLCCGK